MKTMKQLPPRELMKPSQASSMKKMRKLKSNTFHLKSNQFISNTLMKEQSEKTLNKQPRRKRIKRRDSSQQRDLSLQRKRRLTW
jgi:hypothetical protein